MRKALAIALVVLASGIAAFAQSESKGEIFGGYQYLNLDVHELGSGKNRVNLNGWNAAATGYFTKHLGVTADFSGSYGSPDFGGGVKPDTTIYSYMFGPSVRFGNEKVQPFVHGLFGGVHGKLKFAGVESSDNSFGMALGGGVDVSATKNVAVRIGQFDYVYSKFADANDVQNNFRYSAGIVFRF